MVVLEDAVPRWRDLRILEASPVGAGSLRMSRECSDYTPTVFREGAAAGQLVDGIRTENLQELSFDSESFDIVITQDVFEHVLDPARGLQEIGRVLRHGGRHVFTVPCDFGIKTRPRVELGPDGSLVHLLPKLWHGDPYEDNGALVITDWGSDIVQRVTDHCGMSTETYRKHSRRLGLIGEQLEVFVSRKA